MAKKKKNVEKLIKWKDYTQCKLYHYDEWINMYAIFNDTFRSSVIVYVWDLWEEKSYEFFKRELKKYWAEDEYNYQWNWLHIYNNKIWSIIFLKNPDLSTLVHELVHSKQSMFLDRWIDWDETEAYYMQMLIWSILSLDVESCDNIFKYYPIEQI